MSKLDQAKTWEGRVVDGKFTLRQYLGGSDHRAVFLTEATGNAAPKIAIKLIAVDAGDAENQLSRLRAAVSLTHPHLIRLFDVGRGEIDGSSFLYATIEFADEDLSQILPQRALTPDEVRDMLPPVLEALAFLHGRGFVHGSVKPSNIHAVGEQLKLSADEITAVGKPVPRIYADEGSFDSGLELARAEAEGRIAFPTVDIQALGATLVEALTQNEIPEAIEPVPGSVPEPFRSIARDCLQPDPKRRPSIEQIYARLQKQAASAPAVPAPSSAKPPQAAHAPQPGRRRMYVIASLVLAAIIVIGYFLFRGKESTGSGSESATQPASETTPPETAASPRNPSSVSPSTSSSNAEGKVALRVIPEIPENAQRTISGVIKIRARVEVDASGKVTAAKLISVGPSHYFSERVLTAVQKWQFSAPVVNGQAKSSVWLVQFRLRRDSIQDSAAQLKP